jgi:diguanylate cyclase (GGDEF)-like protein
VLFLAAGLAGLYAAVFPIADSAPRTEIVFVSVFSVAASIVFWIVGSTVSSKWVYAFLVIASLGLSATVAAAISPVGIAVASIISVWVGIFVGRFCTGKVARIYLVWICFTLGVGLLVSDVERSFAFWPILAATLTVTTETMLRLSEQLRRLATRDPLTGLLNRLGLEEAASAVLASFDRTGLPVSLSVMDLDDFGLVNDREGHIAGDRLLVELARCWDGNVRSGDILARFGGDEFILLMPDTDLAGGRTALDRLDRCHHIEWSAGLVEFRPGENLFEAIERADRLLYIEKAK